jgi:hypothetical protein
MARPERFELPTSWFVAMRSIQLSYGRNVRVSRCTALQRRTSIHFLLSTTSAKWRRERDSNPRRAFDPYTLSRGAPSTTRPSLRCQSVLPGLSRTCGARYSAHPCAPPCSGPTSSPGRSCSSLLPADLSTTRPSLRCQSALPGLESHTAAAVRVPTCRTLLRRLTLRPLPRRPGRILSRLRPVKGKKERMVSDVHGAVGRRGSTDVLPQQVRRQLPEPVVPVGRF